MVRSLIASRLALLAALGAALGGAACSTAESPAAANTAPAVIDIGRENVVAVKMTNITVGPLISGDLRAQREATVRAELGGSVLQVVPDEGQAIKQGALLARIEARTQEDALRSAESMVRSADESLSVADRELARTDRLVKGGALAERELESARNAAVLARAQRDDAQSRLASARKALDDGTVRAPISGAGRAPPRQPRRRRQLGHRALHNHQSVEHAARGLGALRAAGRHHHRRDR